MALFLAVDPLFKAGADNVGGEGTDLKLMVFVLGRVELLDELLEGMAGARIGGATILQSRGMARTLYQSGRNDMFLGSLRAILDPDRDESRTILAVVRDEQVEDVVRVIEDVVGDLSEPDTGIVFTLPVDFIKGMRL